MENKKKNELIKKTMKKIKNGENSVFLIEVDEQNARGINHSAEPTIFERLVINLGDPKRPQFYGYANGNKIGEFKSIKILLDLQKEYYPLALIIIDGEEVRLTALNYKYGEVQIFCTIKTYDALFQIINVQNTIIGKVLLANNLQSLYLKHLFLKPIQQKERSNIEHILLESNKTIDEVEGSKNEE